MLYFSFYVPNFQIQNEVRYTFSLHSVGVIDLKTQLRLLVTINYIPNFCEVSRAETLINSLPYIRVINV